MTRTFFCLPERINQMVGEAYRWIGTPFCHHACSLGFGVDCIHLVAAIYRTCGIKVNEDWPIYHMDGGSHLSTSMLHDVMQEKVDLKLIPLTEPTLPGDLLTFKTGRVAHHAGLKLLDSKFIQARSRMGVIETELGKLYGGLLVGIYRPMEEIQ